MGISLKLLLAFSTSFLTSIFVLPALIRFAIRKNLVVSPDRRKIHKQDTPSFGGIAIVSGFILSFLFWVDMVDWVSGRFLIGSLIIVFIWGVRDDLISFKAWNKLAGQIISIDVLLFSGIRIDSLYGLFGVYEIPKVLGILLTIIFIIIVTNAFNLIDGIDGLAGTVSIVSYISFGIWFILVEEYTFSTICFAMIGGMLAFLFFNWQPAKIFMGDSGALVNGMLLAVLTIQFMNVNIALPGYSHFKFMSTVGTAAGLILVPLFDTSRVIILRLSKGISPMTADKNHIHHGLVRLGLNHAKATIILTSLSLLITILMFAMRQFPDSIVIPIVIVVCIILGVLLDRKLIQKASKTVLK